MRFCGMVEDEPRPSWNGSNTSSTSVCIISFTSKAILPQMPVTRPRKQPTSAMRSCTVCQAISGWARFKFLGQLDLRPQSILAERRQRAGGAAELEHEGAFLELLQPLLVALEGGEIGRAPCSRR